MEFKRFGVQVGDDGRWLRETDNVAEAAQFARDLSLRGLGLAQLVDFEGGTRRRWVDGVEVTR